jgi:DNA repair exonuclease SbcCD ATPase subunit
MPRDRTETGRDATEGARRLDWLEEERRRDKATLNELLKKQEQYDSQLAHAQEVMEALEERLAQTVADVKSATRFDRALQQYKEEILLELRKSEERFVKENEGRDRRQREETQQRLAAVAKLEQRIAETSKFQDALQTQQVDIERLTKTASAFQLQLDEVIKQLKGQQERLLAFGERVNKGETMVSEVSKAQGEEASRSESVSESLRLLQVRMDRADQERSAVESVIEQLRQAQSEVGDELRRVDDRGKKQISGWTKEMSTWRKDAEAVREQITIAGRQAREAQSMLSALDAMRIQLEKDRDSIQHMERTAEERQRQQLEDWRKENELLWLRNDERWDQQADENARRDDHIARLWETQLAYLHREVAELEKLIKGLDKRLMRPNR